GDREAITCDSLGRQPEVGAAAPIFWSRSDYLRRSGSRFATKTDYRLSRYLGLAPEAITGNRFAIRTPDSCRLKPEA
ncbi:MAG: hypothetical protein ACTHK7_21740, partial [Aureliella sp.]